MGTDQEGRRAALPAPDLEHPLRIVEDRLAALASALQRQDVDALDRVAGELHHALAAAVDHFARAARAGGVPPGLRQRLIAAGGQVAAQREALARATASLDRAIEVLLPTGAAPGLYTAAGDSGRLKRPGGSLLA